MEMKRIASWSAGLIAAAAPLASFSASKVGVKNFQDLIDVFCRIINDIFVVFIILVVVFVAVAAFYYLTSAGDPEKVKKANKTITYAAVAVAVALFAYVFPSIIMSILDPSGTLPKNCGV